jgi:hypothetical protein
MPNLELEVVIEEALHSLLLPGANLVVVFITTISILSTKKKMKEERNLL